MSRAKEALEEQEEKREVAIQIAIAAGVLQQCKYHDDCIFEGNEEIEIAYKLANHQFSHGEHVNVFKNRREMTDIIKEVVADYPGDECPSCARVREE